MLPAINDVASVLEKNDYALSVTDHIDPDPDFDDHIHVHRLIQYPDLWPGYFLVTYPKIGTGRINTDYLAMEKYE